MIWAFHRRGEQVRCEVRREANGDGYEFALTRVDGVEEIEHFDDASALIERSVACLERLRHDGWVPAPA